jgi:hypothetical protein
MIASQIKNRQPIGLLMAIAILLGAWIWAGLQITIPPVKYSMPLFELVVSGLKFQPLILMSINVLLILITALTWNNTLNANELLPAKTWYPAFFYMLFMSSSPLQTQINPIIFSNAMLALIVYRIMDNYRKDEAFAAMFDSGFYTGIGMLFYFPVIILFPLIWVALIVMRPFIWREWIIALLGLSIPLLFTFTYYFWYDSLNVLVYDKIFYPTQDFVFLLSEQRTSFLLVGLWWLVCGVLSILHVMLKGWTVNTIVSRNFLVFNGWFLALSLISFLMVPVTSFQYFSLVALPLSIYLSNYFIQMKRQWIADLLILFIAGAIVYEFISF